MPKFKEADLVDRISISLDDEQKAKLTRWIDEHKDTISIDRSAFIERQKKFLFSYDDFITFTRKGPWDDSANIHTPLTAIMVKTLHSRLYNIFMNEDTTQFIPREPMDENRVEILKKLRSWYMWDYINEYKGIRGVANELFWDVCTVGYGLLLKDWEIKQRKSIVLEKVELQKEMAQFEGEIEEAKQTGKKASAKPYKEVQKILTCFEGTRLSTVPFENAYFPNFIPEVSDLDYPQCVIVITEKSESEIRLKAAQKIWDDEAVDAVLQEQPINRQARSREATIKEIRDTLTGYQSENSYTQQKKFEIEFCFCSYDIDEDGIDEEIIVARSEKGTILNVNYLDRVSPSGKRPIFKFDCFSKPRQAYSRGVPEFMYPLQEEMDMTHNMRLNYGQIQTCPFGVYRGSSALNNKEIKIAPGKFIPVDEVTDLRVITFNANAQLLVGEEDRNWQHASWLMSQSPISTGNVPDSVGPLRSTSGVASLLNQMDKQFRPMVDQFALNWRKVELSILEDLDFRVSPAIKSRVLGASLEEIPMDKDQLLYLNQNMLLTQLFDLKIDVANVITSEEVKQNQATVLLQQFSAPTLLQQTGIVSPKTLYKMASDFLRSYGKDPKVYLTKPQMIDEALTLWQEIQVCRQGEMPPMSMQDNHEEKANDLMAFLETPEYQEAKMLGTYDPMFETLIQRTSQKHQSLAQALQAQGGPNPTGVTGQPMGETQIGVAPQQGGQNPQLTTSRDLPAQAPQEQAPEVPPLNG